MITTVKDRVELKLRPAELAAKLGYPGWTLFLHYCSFDDILQSGVMYQVILERVRDP